MAQPLEAVVIGGGAVGLACALRLSALGAKVVLIEPDVGGQPASFGNAGRLATELAEPFASLKTLWSVPGRCAIFGGALDLIWRDLDLVAPWALQYLAACRPAAFRRGTGVLGALLGQAIPAWRRMLGPELAAQHIRCDGHHLLWGGDTAYRRALAAWQAKSTGPASFRPLSDAEAARFAEVLRQPQAGGLTFDGTGELSDSGRVLAAMLAKFVADGGEVVRDAAARIDRTPGGRIRVVLASGGTVDAALGVVAAGARSAALVAPHGERAPLIGERGYHLHFAEHDWPRDIPNTTFEDRSVSVTAFTSGLRVTSNVEFGRPGSPPDPGKWRRLAWHVRDLGLPVRGEPSRWMGARPTLPDFLPAIGRCRAAPNLLYAFGHQHIGMTLSAITGEIIGALASDAPPPVATAPLSLARFG
ncbi:MAG TPA: FAD-binding oxidoreductase [Caulobacteraceae bacterium]|nr:FAD-binding oxidoreductase [Caulobacteraceae bacterium]